MGTNRVNHLYLLASVMAVVCAVYWQSIFLPFVQDDWGLLRAFQTNDSLTLIKEFFKYENKLFYRPLAQGYLLLMYKLFGPNPIPVHAVALIVHALNSFIIALILNIIVHDRLISYLSALVYAAAIAIHLDPLTWAVGFYDVGGAFLFFFSMWLFLRNKPVASVSVYLFGCLFKETIIVLPVILFSYLLLMNIRNGLKETILSKWKQTLPFFVVMGLVAIIKLSGQSLFDLPATHPYAFDIIGHHVIKNIFLYSAWMFQSFFPFLSVLQHAFQFVIFGVALVLLCGTLATFRLQKEEQQLRRLLFLIVWLLVGLLPVLFLPNHTYRYYATYSLPAFIVLLLILFKNLFLSFDVRYKVIAVILISICSFAVIGSIFQGNQVYRETLSQNTLSNGTNWLIRRAAFVDIVRKGLRHDLPNIPNDSFIVIGGCDLWSFEKDSGPQFWYNNGTIRVYALRDLKYANGLLYIDRPIENPLQAYTGSKDRKIFPDPSKLFIYQISNGQLIRIDLRSLQS